MFSFESIDYTIKGNTLHVKFEFFIDDTISFSSVTSFHFGNFAPKLTESEIRLLLFHIGMVECISYWKSSCPPNIVIKPFQLNNDQIQWWKKLWFNGLGEFFWLNGIETDLESFVTVRCESENQMNSMSATLSDHGVIVPVGGGKDSVVTLEFFRSLGREMFPMLVNPRAAMTDTVKACGISNTKLLTVNRSIDPRLLELNAQGYLNGHTPFSSLLAFQSLLFSCVTGIQDVALSNESSANESTVPGTNINHQYSKSLEFETDFRNYVHSYLLPGFNYYSVLRPLSELQIAFAFSHFQSHFSTFKSCNVGSKQNIWCGKCPKCLFTAIILLPFNGQKKLIDLFGYDIFDNSDLLTIFRELTGMDDLKPFECVGTPDEINLALSFAIANMFDNENLPFLLKYFSQSEKMNTVHFEEFYSALRQHFDTSHHLTPALYEQLTDYIRNLS